MTTEEINDEFGNIAKKILILEQKLKKQLEGKSYPAMGKHLSFFYKLRAMKTIIKI